MVEVQRERRAENERIAVLETELMAMKKQHADMAADIKTILATLSEAKGGWRVMMMVGGASGVLGAFISKWIGPVSSVLPK
jgi:chromosome condensin MukBEF ATPase and DNA-binding subunit MukB